MQTVCKTWHNLISDPKFAKLHFSQSEVYPLLHTSGFNVLSRMLYLVQPEKENFELELDCNCRLPEHDIGCACYVKVKLSTKFRLPLRNLQMVVSDKNNEAGRNNVLKLNMKDHKYKIVNACNGLLCSSDPSNNEPMVVCNPITGEFITLPEERRANVSKESDIACSFGFSPMTNRYKVIRMLMQQLEGNMVAEMHIVGTKSWKYLGVFPFSFNNLMCPTDLNGYLYWYSHREFSVIFFDFEKGCFGSFSPPSSVNSLLKSFLSMGVLGSELCISKSFIGYLVEFWIMKDCDGKRNWVKMISIDMNGNERWPAGSDQPIKYLNNGALLMYNSVKCAFLYHNPKELGYRYLKIRRMESKVVAVSHIPSFVSLKDALSVLETTVLNVSSRCGELKLYNEGK